MGNEFHDDLDQMLDGVLRSYIAEPRAGLESRVLHRVRARRRYLLRFAVPVAASLMCGLLVFQPHEPERISIVVSGPVVPVIEPVINPEVLRDVPIRAHRRILPRLDQFPTPSPLSAEERALLQVAMNHPEDAHVINPGPIEIPQLEIKPLTMDGGL